MKYCPKCGTAMEDASSFCPNCGYQMGGSYVDPYDHTTEFEAQDVSDNKVYAMLGYLTGILGIIVALLACPNSAYIKFHIRQLIKFTVVKVLTYLAIGVLCWTIVVPVAGAVFTLVILVIQVICFFKVCSGKSVEPPIVRALPFPK